MPKVPTLGSVAPRAYSGVCVVQGRGVCGTVVQGSVGPLVPAFSGSRGPAGVRG